MADERQPSIIFSAGAGNTAAVFAQVKGELAGLGSAVSQARGLILSLAGAFGVGISGAAIKGAAEAADAAAKMGDRYIRVLEHCEESVARNVTGNLFTRHIQPLFID